MTHRAIAGAIGAFLLTLPMAAGAECTGPSCSSMYDDAIATFALYAVTLLVFLGILIARKWRVALYSFFGFLLLILVVPMVSLGLQSWKLYAMERLEVVGTPPPVTTVTALFVTPGEGRNYDFSKNLVMNSGERGVIALPLSVFEAADLSAPLDLVSLPLEFWQPSLEWEGGDFRIHLLTAQERADVAQSINYLILSPEPFYLTQQGPIEHALKQNPTLTGMGQGAVVKLALIPLQKGQPLDLSKATFDLLDLHMTDQAFGLPLGVGYFQSADNTSAGADIAARALCKLYDGQPEYDCEQSIRR